MEEPIQEAIKSGKIPETRIKKLDINIRDAFSECGMDSKISPKVKEIFKSNIFIDETRGQVHAQEVMEMILDMFEDVMTSGPLAREPCINVKVRLIDMKLHEDAIHRGPAQVYPAIRDGIRDAIRTAGPMLYEPLQIQMLEAPMEYMGELSKLIGNKRGQLLEMNQQGYLTVVKAKLPVAEMFGWSSELRSATEGRGVSFLIDQMFEKMPFEQQEKSIKNIRARKGLTENQ
ncbi:TPA: hypothetical protein HA246_01650 [Candidatus Woesearchaeota archaeon]|nr:hypothetical protein [Candidatus Woesearchaeota archaeon]